MDLLTTATSMNENSRAMVMTMTPDKHDVVWDLAIACEGVLQLTANATNEFCYKLDPITHRDIKEELKDLIPTP